MRNRKKHSRAKRFILAGFCLLAVATCAPIGKPQRATIVRLPPATHQPSAQPSVADARRLSSEADAQSAIAADQVSRAGKGMKETQQEMQQLVETTMRLRQQKAASESDLLKLYNRLVEQEKRMRMLVSDISDAETSLASERNMRQQVSVKLSEAEALIAAKDAEALQLRDQLVYMNDVAEAARKMADDNAALAGKESARADSATGASNLKTRLLLGTGGLLLLACGVIFLLVRTKLPI